MKDAFSFARMNFSGLDGYLLAKEIPHELHIYGDSQNPRGHVFHCDQKDPLARQCNLDELNFFADCKIKLNTVPIQ